MGKYDWVKLRREFTTYKKYATMSLCEFARVKGIPDGANFRQHTAGWLDDRVKKQSKKSQEIENRITEQEIKSAEEINRRHLEVYQRALDVAETILSKQMGMSVDMFGKEHTTNVYSAGKLKSVVQALEILQKGQRICLGMDKDFNQQEQADESAIDSLLNQLRSRKPKEDDGDRV